MASNNVHVATVANQHIRSMLGQARGVMKEMQPTPIGTVPRSPQEKAALWRKLTSLDKPEAQVVLEQMAKRANHQPGEKKACELCSFLAEHLQVPKE